MPLLGNLLDGASKFRENNADSVLFHLNGHTPSLARTMVQSRELPKPRKGNLGTNKTFINIRIMRNIAAEGLPERLVPQILKIEMSNPVGVTQAHLDDILSEAGTLITYHPATSQDKAAVFLEGNLIQVFAEEV